MYHDHGLEKINIFEMLIQVQNYQANKFVALVHKWRQKMWW